MAVVFDLVIGSETLSIETECKSNEPLFIGFLGTFTSQSLKEKTYTSHLWPSQWAKSLKTV